MGFERLCRYCWEAVTLKELYVRCDYCNWSMHLECSDLTVEDYCRLYRTGRYLQYICDSCEPDFGEEANSHNFDEILKSNERMKATPTSEQNVDEESSDSENDSDSSYDSEEEITITDEMVVPPEVLKAALEEHNALEYTMVENGTRGGKPVLKCNDGYSYTKGKVGFSYVIWRCQTRNRGINDFGPTGYCSASVTQRGDTFTRGPAPHKHFNETGLKDWKKEQKRLIAKGIIPAPEKKVRKKRQPQKSKQCDKEVTEAAPVSGNATLSQAELEEVDSAKDVLGKTPAEMGHLSSDIPAERNSEVAEITTESGFVNSERSVVFTIVEGGSKRKGRKLIGSDGFTYNYNNSTSKSTYWRCSARNKAIKCSATVIQKNDTFVRGSKPHCHDSEQWAIDKTSAHTEIKGIVESSLSIQNENDIEASLSLPVERIENEIEANLAMPVERTENDIEVSLAITVEQIEDDIDTSLAMAVEQNENYIDASLALPIEQIEYDIEANIVKLVEQNEKDIDANPAKLEENKKDILQERHDHITITLPDTTNPLKSTKGKRRRLNKHVCPYC